MTENDRVRWWIAFRKVAEAHGLDLLDILETAEELRLAGKSPSVAVATLMAKEELGGGQHLGSGR